MSTHPMDVAADRAIKEFSTKVIPQMSPEERNGAQKLVDWLRTWRDEAGYKRPCRYLFSLKINGPE